VWHNRVVCVCVREREREERVCVREREESLCVRERAQVTREESVDNTNQIFCSILIISLSHV